MKFRLFLALALLLGAAALSGLTATVKVHVTVPLSSPTAYLRVYYVGEDPPHLTEVTLTATSQEFYFGLEESHETRIVADLYCSAGEFTEFGVISYPYITFDLD